MGIRFVLLGAYMLMVFHPASPIFAITGNQTLAVTLPFFLALLTMFELGLYHWSGAARLRRALHDYRSGDLADARKLLETVLRRNRHPSVSARASTLLAALEIEKGRFAEAADRIRAARELAESRPEKAHHLALEGLIQHLLSQPRQALSRLESANSMSPRKPVRGLIYLVRAALQLLHERNTTTSLERLDRAANSPGHPFADRQFPLITALALAESGCPDEARSVLASARGPMPLTPLVIGRVLHIEGDLENAVSSYREALDSLPRSFILYRALASFYLGAACIELGQVQEGSKMLHEALCAPLPKPYREAIVHQVAEEVRDGEEVSF
jgi:tetratricopeptide (TPR) repeat protein